MSTYADIGQWAADTAHYTRDLQGVPLAVRRSSFSGSTASESSLLSDASQQSSATSFSNVSFTASEQEVNSDLDSGNDFIHGKDFIHEWRTGSLSAEDQNFSEYHLRSSNTSPSDNTPVYHSAAACNGKLHLASTHNNWTTTVHHANRSSHGLAARKAGSTWDHRAALRESQSNNVERETWPGAAKDISNKAAQHSQKALLSQVCALRRRCTTDARVQGSQPVVPISVGTNPRRTSTSRSWSKPSLVRQQERRDDFVLNLVGQYTSSAIAFTRSLTFYVSLHQECATQLVAYLWPNATHCPVVTLNFFIQETLRRSRSTYSTLQLTLYYLYLVRGKDRLSSSCASSNQNTSGLAPRGMECGRRMFLAALILASKYLQDRNFSTNAWTKITNLPAQEINTNEKLFLSAMGYSLHLPLQKYNDWCNKVQRCVDFATLGRQCPWHEVLQEYTAVQLSLDTASQATTHTFGSAQLSSSPTFTDFANKAGADTMTQTRDEFRPPTAQKKFEDQKLVTPVFFASRNKIPMAPPAPTLDRKLTTPQSSPWSNACSTSAASTTGMCPGYLSRGGSFTSTTNMEPLRYSDECSLPFVNLQPPSLSGSQKAPELAATAACLATSQSNDGDVVMCTNPAEFTCSPLSLNGSEDNTSQRLRCGPRRKGAVSSVWGTTSAACYLPSPLRSSMTPQLPTPPHSSASTELLDLVASFDEAKGTGRPLGSAKRTIDLTSRVALGLQKHGMETLTLPPMVAPKVYESFSDCSSDFTMDTPATSFSDTTNCSSIASYHTDHPMQNTMDPLQQYPLPATLPAITQLLREGLREHLRPVMQGLQLDCRAAAAAASSDMEAARALGSLKRSFSATEAACGPVAKARRIFSCRVR